MLSQVIDSQLLQDFLTIFHPSAAAAAVTVRRYYGTFAAETTNIESSFNPFLRKEATARKGG